MVIYSGFSQWEWWFSIAMLNYQRVNCDVSGKKPVLISSSVDPLPFQRYFNLLVSRFSFCHSPTGPMKHGNGKIFGPSISAYDSTTISLKWLPWDELSSGQRERLGALRVFIFPLHWGAIKGAINRVSQPHTSKECHLTIDDGECKGKHPLLWPNNSG